MRTVPALDDGVHIWGAWDEKHDGMKDTRREVMGYGVELELPVPECRRDQVLQTRKESFVDKNGRLLIVADWYCLPPRSILFGLHEVKSARCIKRLHRVPV